MIEDIKQIYLMMLSNKYGVQYLSDDDKFYDAAIPHSNLLIKGLVRAKK